jgi:glycerophosphoryl diester phosphodiesterase
MTNRGATMTILIGHGGASAIAPADTVAAEARTAISIDGHIARRANRWHPRNWREQVLHELAAGRFGDVMLHHKLVDAEMAQAVGRLGRQLLACDEPALFARIADLGVAGVATNDPARLRAPL